MASEFANAWKKYDVNNEGYIQEAVVPTYLRSLLGDFTAQFGLSDKEKFQESLNTLVQVPYPHQE
jgi:hypothetical protein